MGSTHGSPVGWVFDPSRTSVPWLVFSKHKSPLWFLGLGQSFPFMKITCSRLCFPEKRKVTNNTSCLIYSTDTWSLTELHIVVPQYPQGIGSRIPCGYHNLDTHVPCIKWHGTVGPLYQWMGSRWLRRASCIWSHFWDRVSGWIFEFCSDVFKAVDKAIYPVRG